MKPHSIHRSKWPAALLGVALLSWTAIVNAASSSGKVEFNRDIRPILSRNCFACHGPDAKERKADLRLDTRAGIFADLGGYAAVTPGKPDKSELYARMTTKDQDDVMPPPDSHNTIKREELSLIKRWIEQGAVFQGHWAYEPVADVQPPAVSKYRSSARNEIDAFILDRLAKVRLKPSPEADRETLIRRVTLDLTGLPPTLAEVNDFLADQEPGAYERLVDRLMKSPHYGEHMARYWLDVARYGDTHGLHLDNERSMWPYRDWVVQAFSKNMPFDQFTVWQIAGDLLPNATREQQIASGFNRCNVTTSEGGSIDAEYLFRYAVDRTETTAAVWMGMTAGCAVCHDHKFDPLTTKDFYSLYAFFYSAADPAMDGNALKTPPILKLSTPEQEQKLASFDTSIAELKEELRKLHDTVKYQDPATLDPKPAVTQVDTVWVEDEFPKNSKIEATEKSGPEWVTEKNGRVFSGTKAVKVGGEKATQAYFSDLKQPFELPFRSKAFVHVWLDPKQPPKAVMIQFNTGSWSHRAVWGDLDAIDFGKKDTNERRRLGDLPKLGEWVKLEFPLSKLGLNGEEAIKGLAFTQAGGTVYWDKAGVTGEHNPVEDPVHSLAAWEKQHNGKTPKDYPKDIQDIFKKGKPEERKPAEVKKLREYYLENICVATKPDFGPVSARLKTTEGERTKFDDAIPVTFIMKDLDKPRDAFVMQRGQYTSPGEQVFPNVPAAFAPLPASETTNRLDLAHWLVDPQNPLTARVTVNRFWQQFFGTGIVRTADDFGSQGEPPSHPELLDWLAHTFVQQAWDVKKLVKLMVTSATYRQNSKVSSAALATDPENRLYARGPRFRMDAETIRDNALFLSGLMDLTLGGKGVRPYQPENIWEPVGFASSNTRNYKQDDGSALYRRSLYTFWKRTAPPPSMTTFDAPSREQFCVRRERSNTPLQALLLMNDVQHFEAARAFAERMLTEGGDSPKDRLAWAFRIATSRTPAAGELRVLADSLEKQSARYAADPEAAKKAIGYGESKPDPKLNPSELAAYTLVANLILNLDEVVTKN